MTNLHGDIAGFLRTMQIGPKSTRTQKPFLGIDECVNCKEIAELARRLIKKGLIDSAGPLWERTHERNGVLVCSIPGGVDKDSLLRKPNPLLADVGVPVEHRSWSDFQVVQMLVANFLSNDRLILLSANTRDDAGGLRRLLNEIVAPSLAHRPEALHPMAIFKR